MSTWTLNQQLTLIETAKREHWGEALPIAEILHQSRPMLQHAPIVEANEFFSNVALQRFKLPAGSFRVLNFGVPTEMSQVKQIRDQIGILESYAEHDKKLVDSQPNPTKFRNDENVAFIEGLGQTISYTLFYGNAILGRWRDSTPLNCSCSAQRAYPSSPPVSASLLSSESSSVDSPVSDSSGDVFTTGM